jgi:hypothetical protein
MVALGAAAYGLSFLAPRVRPPLAGTPRTLAGAAVGLAGAALLVALLLFPAGDSALLRGAAFGLCGLAALGVAACAAALLAWRSQDFIRLAAATAALGMAVGLPLAWVLHLGVLPAFAAWAMVLAPHASCAARLASRRLSTWQGYAASAVVGAGIGLLIRALP